MVQNTTENPTENTIETMLRQKLGLDADSVGSRLIERAVEQRQSARHVPDRSAYLALVRSSAEELNQLIEAVVVPETWFFRDREPFEYLRYYVKEKFAKSQLDCSTNSPISAITPAIASDQILRILSIPCSTGEEPYSIAMMMLDAGLTTAQFRIDAVDISQQALLKARQGVYRKKSFRGGAVPNAVPNLERYFKPVPEGYEVRSIVRESVNLIQGNILEPHFLVGKRYHVIFCRNLLIYLDEAARDRVLELLDRALLPLGLLFLGSAETAQMSNRPYEAIDHPFAFAYRKKMPIATGTAAKTAASSSNHSGNSGNAPAPLIKPREPAKANSSKIHLSGFPSQQRLPALESGSSGNKPATQGVTPQGGTPAKPTLVVQPPLPMPMETAKQLADRGELTQAAQLCESYVRTNPAQPDAYLLLGEIYQGLNQSRQAERCFQKAIYLDPNAYEALIHLALLKEQQGSPVEAQRLKRRAQRLVDQEC